MATWGEFQSLIQLSAALNGTFAALGTFLDKDTRREKEIIEKIIEKIDKIDYELIENKSRVSKKLNAKTRLILLKGNCNFIERKFNIFIYKILRSLCAALFVTSIVLLIVSSFLYSDIINYLWSTIILLHITPFFIGICYSAYLLVICKRKITRPRREIELEIWENRHSSQEAENEGSSNGRNGSS